jgi:hypothetical protein
MNYNYRFLVLKNLVEVVFRPTKFLENLVENLVKLSEKFSRYQIFLVFTKNIYTLIQ